MARKLRDRLALASYKARNGQETLSFKDVEARLDGIIRRKRPCLDVEGSSTCSSSSSEHQYFSGGAISSPISGPIFSSGDTKCSHDNKNTYQSMNIEDRFSTSKRMRSCSTAPPLVEKSGNSWTSPTYQRESHFSTLHGPNLSFASEISTIPDSPPFGHASDEEGGRLKAPSFRPNRNSQSSPPRTPPPTRSRHRKSNGGEEGAELLLHLAASPSPAKTGHKPASGFAPSTPTSTTSAAPYSTMHTAGMGVFNTPGQQFNFADFVNITPSPAQGAFGNRTPGLAKTPLAAREARKRLNFDALVPPGGSPILSNVRGTAAKDSALELGGELVS